jgi:poly-gamma-glutamate synthesis protein (capsule biosynthesis protein)
MRRRCVALALAATLLAACSAGGDTAQPTPAPAAPVRVTFGGDIHAEPPIDGVLARGDNPLADLADTLRAADLAVVNVETAVGSGGTPADKQYTFQAPPSLWPALVEAGVEVVTLANNHALDFGREALIETIEGARAAGLTVVGAGRDAAEAYAPAVVEVGGRTVAVVGLTRVLPVIEWAAGAQRPGLASAYDVEAAAEAVRAAAAQADAVAVVIHWGRELEPCPVEHQLELAAALTAAGADVVAGHHAHRLQGVTAEDGTVVAYGLGNLVFYATSEVARTTALLTVTLDDTGAHDPVLTPARIDTEGSPRLLGPAAADAVRADVADLAPGAGTCPGSPART